jgi:hypothetical protein
VKVLVLGHSNSEGILLSNRDDAWPSLLPGILAEAGVKAEVVHKRLFAGPSAAAMLRKNVEKEEPDVVVLCTSTYGVVVQLVSNQVRERWGERAGRLARRVEDYGARPRHRRRRPSKTTVLVFLSVRKAVRKVVGTLPTHSIDDLARYYEDCFRTLAQFEAVQGIILTGVGYGPAVERLNPGWEEPQNAVYARLKPEALRHRFTWVPHEELLGGPAEKLKHFHFDGIHTDEESHRIAAVALARVILEPVRIG